MHVAELLPEIEAFRDCQIKGLTDDSRQVTNGDLFLAVAGHETDGRQFVADALDRGARLVIAQSPFDTSGYDNVLVIPELDLRRGEIAARYHHHPSREMLVCAVTGTNGKSSVTHYVAQSLNALSRPCGIVGTLGVGMIGDLTNLGATTPGALTLQQSLASLRDGSAQAVSIEASSHGLDQGRLLGCEVDVAVLTNISNDHLDYHGSFDAYKQAKFSLFDLPTVRHWIVNVDDASGRELIGRAAHPVNVVRFSLTNDVDSDVHVLRSSFRRDGIEAQVQTPWGTLALHMSLLGKFNLSNVLATVGVLGALGYSLTDIERSIRDLQPVIGRMQVFHVENGPTVVVDYAHTPDALSRALEAVKLHVSGRMVCVFGCGGDRDVDKRPMMGQAAAQMADHIVLTDDNPRTEPASQIIKAIRDGVPEGHSVEVIADRAEAITRTITGANEGDVVLIAGKGHEEYQIIDGQRYSHSDIALVRALES